MANHSFVTSKKHFKADQIELDLQEILERRFNNKVIYTRDDNYFRIMYHEYAILSDVGSGFEMWIETRRKLEFRNPQIEWNWWVLNVIQNELAYKYDGTISDEGVSESWKGIKNKYPTYVSFIYEYHHDHAPSIYRSLFGWFSRFVPDDFKLRR